MAPDMLSLTESDAVLDKRIAVQQIDALFETITVSVCGGAAAAIFLSATLYHLGAVEPGKGLVWAFCIVLCAAAHILLSQTYSSRRPVGDQWRRWALWFTMISFTEGIGWGWAAIGLAATGHSDVQLLVFLIVGGVAAASIPGFSPYLPAFFALFVRV
jgi:hypothetical protein